MNLFTKSCKENHALLAITNEKTSKLFYTCEDFLKLCEQFGAKPSLIAACTRVELVEMCNKHPDDPRYAEVGAIELKEFGEAIVRSLEMPKNLEKCAICQITDEIIGGGWARRLMGIAKIIRKIFNTHTRLGGDGRLFLFDYSEDAVVDSIARVVSAKKSSLRDYAKIIEEEAAHKEILYREVASEVVELRSKVAELEKEAGYV